MPKFIDQHEMGNFTKDMLRNLQKAPEDEFGVTHHDILFSKEKNKVFCVLNAPNAEAVRKHHEKAGIQCDSIEQIESTRA